MKTYTYECKTCSYAHEVTRTDNAYIQDTLPCMTPKCSGAMTLKK